ncbi:transglutaminase domain-containing protein [Polluticoccus soli]|uniref:transglutaminase domain-containing protein n=1 Tax=Polluticoccus soli TaxID=3034150 RepID=UPI0023E1E578|nr:transglutaminase domain-containing protein [Flavipsychrobacter sp. JY13-12]
MNIQRATPVNELLAKLIFLILPSALISYFLLWNANQYFSILRDQAVQQTIYLLVGMAGAAIFYAFRFRFLPTFLLLMLGLYTVYKGLDKYATGEFDAFFISIQFLVFAILFTAGWLIGWGFIRLRYWSILIAATMLSACILLIAKSNTDSVYGLLQAFAPALIYAVYIIFTSEQIYSYKDKSQKFWWFLTRRLVFFGILAALLLGGVVYMMRGEIKETVANYGGGGKQGENSMLKQNKDGTFDLNDYSRLRSNLGRNNELLFAAHIDNFFPETQIPNPLYLTAFYYTKFDTLTETFERDSTIPYNDLFEPDPSKLPLFFTKTDSSVIKNSLATKLRRSVDIEVYSKKLSPSTYLAPNVGYFIQPITVEKDFRDEFKTAFRAKGYVSELNSAYFIYNSPDTQIRKFQQQRFDVLRTAGGYEGMDRKFMNYYTHMPPDAKFKRIGDLAQQITGKSDKTIDKILAIRDYFLSKDSSGKPLFQYTDNPGVPDIPNASKLMYFLFDNRKGYCAYYAGATLFMLRSLGIPSRITVGFLTVDRADKNKGWYWYYADQAHAWVQVYFPGYGWLDFDTTVGNTDAQESPQPDGTPPMQPPRAWLAIDGIVENVDTLKKVMSMTTKHFIFHDKEYDLQQPTKVEMDVKVATIRRDSVDVPLANVRKGDEATAVSYAEAFKNMKPQPGEYAGSVLARFPSPAPIDEIFLKRKDVAKPEEKPKATQQEQPVSAKKVLLTTLLVLAGLILLILLTPYLIFTFFKWRYNTSKAEGDKAYWAYRTAGFYLHQLGIYRGTRTPMQYARDVIDPQLGTAFVPFMNIYLKKKYAKQPLTASEQQHVANFLSPFLGQVRKRIPFSKRLKGFLNPSRSITFFVKPDDDKQNEE